MEEEIWTNGTMRVVGIGYGDRISYYALKKPNGFIVSTTYADTFQKTFKGNAERFAKAHSKARLESIGRQIQTMQELMINLQEEKELLETV